MSAGIDIARAKAEQVHKECAPDYNTLRDWHRDEDGALVCTVFDSEAYITLTHEDGSAYTRAEEDEFLLLRLLFEATS